MLPGVVSVVHDANKAVIIPGAEIKTTPPIRVKEVKETD